MSTDQPFPPRTRCACGEVRDDFGACAKCDAIPEAPEPVEPRTSTCRWCGCTFEGSHDEDDCGACRLNDAQCREWAKERAAKYHADCAKGGTVWRNGAVEFQGHTYRWSAKVFDDESGWGIPSAPRVSKLSIGNPAGDEIYNYDRGLDHDETPAGLLDVVLAQATR